MSEDEAAFKAAMAAAPDDIAPHLVLADWLDEQGRHEEASYHRQWTPLVGLMESRLKAAEERIEDLKDQLDGAEYGCPGC